MQQNIAIGVDIGGTKIAFAVVDRDGNILATHTEPTLSEQGVDAVIGRVVTGVDKVRQSFQVAGIGMGCPGPVVDGVAINAVNLNWRAVPLVAKTKAAISLDVPVWAQNDVNAGTIAEAVFGAGRGVPDFVFLAVGTGLGGGAVADNHLINGVGGFAMEVGHMSLDPNGRACNCGNHGCVEMYCSGKGLLAGANAYLSEYGNSALANAEFHTREIIEAARSGDPLAQRVFADAADALGTAMAWCVMILNPTLIVLGGGLAAAADDLLFEPSQAAMRARLIPSLAVQVQVARSQVESSALGAAALVWHELGSAAL
ncbi:MAG: ROK family protein [Chloroflexota bacterium]